ncbi:MAG: hypothetical protein L6R37_007939 [Teloschistes peruensis]|nr:MAG: hypothetical protein L6R37_007939 [Teloschistes peruensis]
MLYEARKTSEMTVLQSQLAKKSNPLVDIILRPMLNGHTKATRPEDLVYSVFGIASDADACGIEIDYRKHYTTVYAEVVLLLLKTHGAHGLALSGQLDTGNNPASCRLPSWVPDLRLASAATLHPYPLFGSPTIKLFSASGHSLFEYSADEQCEILSLRTINVDSIIEVSNTFDLSDLDSDDRLAVLSVQQAWLKTFARFLSASLWRYTDCYDYPARKEMPWKIPIVDWYWDQAT